MVINIKENIFLDTNVIIGFVYELDNLNPQSETIISSNDDLYYSFHVKSEIGVVSNRKNNEYARFFSILSSKLRKYKDTDFISKSSLQMFIKKIKPINKLTNENMQYAFNRIWDSFGFGENQEVGEIKLKLISLQVDFDSIHTSNINEFIKKANYIPAHKNKDRKVLNLINTKSLHKNLHGEDEEILFDLHEYCFKHPELNMILVSWDKCFMGVVRELINVLSFNEYVYLDEENNIAA